MQPPQITMIALFALSLGIAISDHGKPKQGNTSFWANLIAVGTQGVILTWGGFFKF